MFLLAKISVAPMHIILEHAVKQTVIRYLLMAADENPDTEAEADANEVGKAIDQFSKSGAFNALFGPSAKLLGDRLAKKLGKFLGEDEQKNLQGHIEAARQELPKIENDSLDIVEVGALIEWMDYAKEVPSESGNKTAEAWQAALVGIFKDDLQLLRELPRLDEATLLIISHGGQASQEQAKLMCDRGLLRPIVESRRFSQDLLIAGVLVWLVFFGALSLIILPSFGLSRDDFENNILGRFVFQVLAIGAAFAFAKPLRDRFWNYWGSTYEHTDKGLYIRRKLARQIAQEERAPRVVVPKR